MAADHPSSLAPEAPVDSFPAGDTASIDVVESPQAFDRLESEWTDLLAASDSRSVFLTWDWLNTWWRRFGEGQRLWVLTVRARGRLVGLAPLSRASDGPIIRGLSVAEFLGTGTVGSDHLDVITRRGFESSVNEALAHWLARTNDVVLCLRGVPRFGSQAERLARRLETHGWTVDMTPDGVCPYLPLAGRTWDDVFASFGPKQRKHVRRSIRTLRRAFDVSFEEARSEADRADALESLIRLHNARWHHRGGSTALDSHTLQAFHRDVTRRLHARGWLRLFTLRLNGTAAACLYGMHYRRTFFFYQSGFDEQLARFSPGLVTLALSIERAVDEGADEFDLLHGGEDYKRHWTPTAHELTRLDFYPPGVRAQLHRAATAAQRAARRWARPWLKPMQESMNGWRMRKASAAGVGSTE